MNNLDLVNDNHPTQFIKLIDFARLIRLINLKKIINVLNLDYYVNLIMFI